MITGHKRAGESYNIDFEALVRTKGTLVFLMGITAMEDICKGLLEAGMDPETPAAVLQQGTTAGQKRVVATVNTLKQTRRRSRHRQLLWSDRSVRWQILLDGMKNCRLPVIKFW